MTLALLPGVRQRIYLGGWNLDNGPSVFEPSVEEAKTSQRLANSTLYTSYASLWTGNTSRITKRDWKLAFDAPSQADLLHLRMLASAPITLDFCPWIAETEYFASLTDATASRRNAVTVISGGLVPTGDWTACWIEVGSDTQYAVTWGSAGANPYHHPFSLAAGGTAPGWLVYYPVYRVEIQTPDVKFALAHLEKHALQLKEV